MKTEFQPDKDSFSKRYGVSLFSGAGIGDLGYRGAGITFAAMCEVEENRSALAHANFPESRHYAQDISTIHEPFCSFVEGQLVSESQRLFLLSCTAPCQGMSKNGQGTLLKNIREGKRPSLDPRNKLILPALAIITRLKPLWVVFENVTEMRNTIIEDAEGRLRFILDIVEEKLAPEYAGEAYTIELADYGVPQRRQRLITVYSRDPNAQEMLKSGGRFVPQPTHAMNGTGGRKNWISVAEALCDFPKLDAKSLVQASHPDIPFHRVPVLDEKKYTWISHTPPGMSAFDNQCNNPLCFYEGNAAHGAERNAEGINQGRKDTPLYCNRCGAMLPRPYAVSESGERKIMSGFTSAYKRMAADRPAPALTRNLSYPCSDQKVHPTQNRVLSLAEAMRLQTISSYPYLWRLQTKREVKVEGIPASDTLIRHVIGESVPPLFFEILARHLLDITFDSEGQTPSASSNAAEQMALPLQSLDRGIRLRER